MNQLILLLEKLLKRYGKKLPPLQERRKLWNAISQTSDEEVLNEFRKYVEAHDSDIHDTLLGEIGRIIYD